MVRYLSTAAGLAVLGASLSQAYLPGRLDSRGGERIRKMAGLYVASSSVVESTVPSPGQPKGMQNVESGVDPVTGARANSQSVETDDGRRWIQDIKSGDKIVGYVRDTTNFAAFVDVGVVRRGAKGKVVPVTGFLHSTEVIPPYALANTKRAEDCEVEVKKGIHLTTFVKDVFPNAGRMTLSLDSSMTREKVLKLRDVKRRRSQSLRRARRAEKSRVPEVGEVTDGYVRKVLDSTLLVDVMRSRLSVVHAASIRRATGGGDVDLRQKVKPGDRITVRIDRIVSRDADSRADETALVEFIGWGGMNDQRGQGGDDPRVQAGISDLRESQ